MHQFQAIRLHVNDLSRLAADIESLSVVSRFGAAADSPEVDEPPHEATVEVMAEEGEDFQPVLPSTGETRPPVDVAAILEAIAAEKIVDAAHKGIEFDLSVEADLVHPSLPRGRLEADVRDYVGNALEAASSGTTISLVARRHHDVIEIRLEGGPEPLHLHLPLPAPVDQNS